MAVTLNPDGSFIHLVHLADGENNFEILGKDSAGNSVMQNMIITKTDNVLAVLNAKINGKMNFFTENIYVFIALILGLLTIAFMYLFTRPFKKKWKLNKGFAVLDLLRNISIPFFVLALGYFGFTAVQYYLSNKNINSESFYKKGLQDPIIIYNGIYDNLGNKTEFDSALQLFLIILSVFALFLGLSLIIPRIFRKKSAKQVVLLEQTAQSSISENDIIPTTESESTIKKTTESICPKCSARNESAAKFCGKCGEKLF
jgi:ribosomal protein L40E